MFGKTTKENIWEAIKDHEGEIFYTVRGLPFTYFIENNCVIPSRQKKKVPLCRSNFERAADLKPQKLSDIPNDIMGQSYVFAIVKELMNK